MSAIEKLASSLGKRDEVPNLELAKEIVAKKDKQAVKELVESLTNNNKDIQSDCIKVLYEIGTLDAKLIADYHDTFIKLLDHKNNRLQWGGMMALHAIVKENPDVIFANISKLVGVAEKGTVITKDNLMGILTKLCAVKNYEAPAFALFCEQLIKSLPNQLPMYAENAFPLINGSNKEKFIKTLTSRLGDIEKETKRTRVEKVIKKLMK